MSAGNNAQCPRCGGPFRCGAGDAHCACFDLKLGEALRRQLATQYGGSNCLCITCLTALQLQAREAEPFVQPAGKDEQR